MMRQLPFPKKQQVEVLTAIMEAVILGGRFADQAITRQFRLLRHWSPREKGDTAALAYECLRYYRLLVAALGHPTDQEPPWAQLIATYFLLQGRSIPPRPEFASMVAGEIQARAAQLRRERALRESIPDWLDARGLAELGAQWDPTLHALNQPAGVVLRANLLRITIKELLNTLAQAGYEARHLGDAAIELADQGELFSLPSFKEGWFEVQDWGSQHVAPFLQVEPGQRVIDACAGNGGKTLHLATLLENRGQLLALDTEDWKLAQLRRRARRAGVSTVEARLVDSTKVIKRLEGSADRVLLDVPCSGLGVLRRNPDTRWHLQPATLERLQQTQAQLLQQYARLVKPGGFLVYATCSILPSENQLQVQQFLAQPNCGFSLDAERVLLPQDQGTDGFYMARLRRS